jgi:hypothetical protein
LSEGEFSDLLRRVDDALQKVIDTTNKIVDACNEAGKWLGAMWDNVVDLLHKFVGLVQKFLSEVGKFITRPGAPLTLWNVGNDWTRHVANPSATWSAPPPSGKPRSTNGGKAPPRPPTWAPCPIRTRPSPRSRPPPTNSTTP